METNMNNDSNKTITISTPSGRPMLSWVNKKPLETVTGYPTQLIETFGDGEVLKVPEYSALEKNWHNLLFHGDNKEVLASLLELGFRGQVDLIYIDPPFASNKDYVRKVELRGLKDLGKIEEESESIIQQTMYEDIWKRDEYFQFMYERLILLKELLAETGSIYVHLDYRMVHYIKILMDEVFGERNFKNQVIWKYFGPTSGVKNFPRKHDTILFYTKSTNFYFDQSATYLEYDEKAIKRYDKVDEQGKRYKDYYGQDGKIKRAYLKEGKPSEIFVIPFIQGIATERLNYTTQKPEKLLDILLRASSNPEKIILDCFMGSGTTCAVAQKLGRRWIGVDVNKGAVQVTSKRLQKIIMEQQNDLFKQPGSNTFGIYKVNNYDLRILKTEAKELAIQQYGITRTKSETFFDGIRDNGELVKIIDFNHPLTLLDLQLVKDELDKRPEEDRDIVVISLGRETKVDAWVEEWNKGQPYRDARNNRRMRQFVIFDLKDKNFVSYEPSKAEVQIERTAGNKVKVKVVSFISPTIIQRLEIEPGLLRKKIPDFRSMIDVVLIDTDYDGEVFSIDFSDIPEKQKDFIQGEYELEIKEKPIKVAVKIIDMLGEEVLITKEL